MFCPECGERIVGDQQFCRSCGSELVGPGRRLGFDPRALIYVGLFLTLAGALVVVLGGSLALKTVALIGCVFALLSFGLMVTGAMLSDTRRRSRKSLTPTANAQTEQPALQTADTTNRLPPIAAVDHFPASVTEQTTTKLRVK